MDNYNQFETKVIGFVSNLEKDIMEATKASGWFWSEFKKIYNGNMAESEEISKSDVVGKSLKNAADYGDKFKTTICITVNGGTNGMSKRLNNYEKLITKIKKTVLMVLSVLIYTSVIAQDKSECIIDTIRQKDCTASSCFDVILSHEGRSKVENMIFSQINMIDKETSSVSQTIELSENTKIFDEIIEDTNTVYWRLIYKSTKSDSIEITLDTDTINDDSMLTKMNIDFFNKENMMLKVPFLVDAFEDGERLYVLLFKHWSIMYQIYEPDNSENYRKTEFILAPMSGGSFENFGDRYVRVLDKQKLENVTFINISYGRHAMWRSEKTVYINTETNQIYEMVFPTEAKNIVKDNRQIFNTLDFSLQQSHSIIEQAIKSTLATKGKLSKASDFKYLWAFDSKNYSRRIRTLGITYFFYTDGNNDSTIKVIRYDNYAKTWLLDSFNEVRIFEQS